MRIVWYAPEIGNSTSGIVNHNKLFMEYFSNHPEVKELVAVQYPFPDHGKMPPFKEERKGLLYYTPRISMPYQEAFKSILTADLSFKERIKVRLFQFILKLKRIKRLDLEQIQNWGMVEFGLLGMASVQLPFPNPMQQQIGKCIAKLKPDIIQSHVEIMSIAGALAKDVAKAHISYQVIVEEEKEFLPERSITREFWNRSEDALNWLIQNQAVDTYIAASDYVANRLIERGVNQSKVKVINSPIIIKQMKAISKSEAKAKLNLPPDKRVILSVGRVVKRKRHIDIIKILKNLPEDVIFYLKRSVSISDDLFPSELIALKKEIKTHKLENRVIINSENLPYEHMHLVYSAADMLVLPFLYEPFGMCAAEAMAAQRPLIVYNSGYLPKFVDGNGFVVEPMDLNALQSRIQTLLENPTMAEEMGAKGPDLVQQFDINVLGEKLLNIYREYL